MEGREGEGGREGGREERDIRRDKDLKRVRSIHVLIKRFSECTHM